VKPHLHPGWKRIGQHVAGDGFAPEANALRRWLDSGSDTSHRKLLSLHHCDIFTQPFSFIQHLKVAATTLKSMSFLSVALLQIVFTTIQSGEKKKKRHCQYIFYLRYLDLCFFRVSWSMQP
jgi:hypothetical protein